MSQEKPKTYASEFKASAVKLVNESDQSIAQTAKELEHVFALTQSLALYDFYQARVDECDVQIEQALAVLNADKPEPEQPIPKARHCTKKPNAVDFDARTAVPIDRRRFNSNSRHRSISGTAFNR
ncbi:MAG: hypothetical protein WAV82_12540 [Methylobacter sp.]